MYIIPVSGCNLGCKYCFIGKINNHTMICMSEQTLLNALQKFSTYLQEHKMRDGTVLFYGGEPTLKFDLVKKAVLFGKTQPVKMKFSIITNGTLLTEEYMKFIKENNIQLSISLDGPKELTDHSRIFKEYNNSVYDNVVQKIQKLKKLNKSNNIFPGIDWNGIGGREKEEFEKHNNVRYEEETMFFLYITGFLKILKIIMEDGEIRFSINRKYSA